MSFLSSIGTYAFWFVVLLILIPGTIFTVQQQSAVIVQRFGKFARIYRAGLNFKLPLIETIAGRVNLRLQQLDVEIETKTKDNVFVRMTVSVQYLIREDKVFDAFYRLQDPHTQIRSFVFDVVRANVPKMPLDEVFENKEDIANAVRTELSEAMEDFGYDIRQTLITDIDPDAKVKQAMNEINTQERLRLAAAQKAEAEYILTVKAAEGEAESKRLQGVGIANQRKEIAQGLSVAVGEFQKEIPSVSPQTVMDLLMVTQHFDMLKDIGAHAGSKVIMVPYTPNAVGDLTEQIRNAIYVGNEMSDNTPNE
ncbi:MAG: SPFH domain-containing protein [Anaerolineales bacterium]|jgi:regulator of protease activity HflC (stomatin/prohibitin superfamily)|nr:SPFH domain-containing protein [Anaerolineales bacterium]MBX3004841.1 SPFH domain-containing protein [Anaerolineales bacterium]MCW5839505.1 SPFH domain-containing protein [Anaerolineales bacterium]MCW5887729.1 SPFH domain-containing protein [Anaerolineales bacterium]